MIRCAIGAYQVGFTAIKNYGKVSTPFEVLDDGTFRDWKGFSQEATMGAYGTGKITRDHLSCVDNK